MTPKIKQILFVSVILVFLVVGNSADAAIINCGGGLNHGVDNECTLTDLVQTVVGIINILLSWAWLVSMVFIVWGGWTMVNSGGNEETITAGKTIFSQAIIGFFLILISYLLINAVIGLLFGTGMPGAGSWLKAFDLLPN